MIGRVLRDRAGQVALVGALGVLVLLVGAVVGSWQVASVGAALALLVVLALGAWATALLQRAQPAPPTVAAPTAAGPSAVSAAAGASPDDAVLAELSGGRALEEALRRSGLAGSVGTQVAEQLARLLREQADLVRLVTRYDVTPPAPLDGELSASTLLAAVTAVHERRPARVLLLGSGSAVLWLAGSTREVGGVLDVVCDDDVVADLAEQTSSRGLADAVTVLPHDASAPDGDPTTRWMDARRSTQRYDLVVVLPEGPGQARSAIDALDPVLERLADDGAVLVGGAAGTDLLGQAWSARPQLRATASGARAAALPQVRRGQDGAALLLVRTAPSSSEAVGR